MDSIGERAVFMRARVAARRERVKRGNRGAHKHLNFRVFSSDWAARMQPSRRAEGSGRHVGMKGQPMLRHLFALSLLAAPAAAFAEPAASDWELARTPGSCMLHAASPQGTVVSVWGFAGQAKLGFLIQNRQWESLREGQSYDIELGFAGARAWPVQATAKNDLDSDGPGYFFTFTPNEGEDGSNFLDSLASAKGLKISHDGNAVDDLPLAGSHDAVAALARCMSELWTTPREETVEKAAAEKPAFPTV
jgi:hypothetical protein